jgi:hypothetical protein
MLTGTRIGQETIVIIDGQTYVQSRSNPATFYRATYDSCECKLAQFRRECRHMLAVSELNKQQRNAPAKGAV